MKRHTAGIVLIAIFRLTLVSAENPKCAEREISPDNAAQRFTRDSKRTQAREHAARYAHAKKMSSRRKASKCFSGAPDSRSLRLTPPMASASIEATSWGSFVRGCEAVDSMPAIALWQRVAICRAIFAPSTSELTDKGDTRLGIPHLRGKECADKSRRHLRKRMALCSRQTRSTVSETSSRWRFNAACRSALLLGKY